MRFHDRFASSLRGGRFAGRFGIAVAESVPTLYYPDGEASFTPVDVQTSGVTPTWKFYDNAGTLEGEYTALEPTHNFVGTGPYRIEIHDGQDLTQLHLGGTQVSGDVGPLSTLTNLEDLRLNGTSVSGDVSALSGLTNLTVINLSSTQVSGDIGALGSLTNLTQLLFYNAQSVSGDIGGIAPLANVIDVNLYNTQVSGSLDIDAATDIGYINVSNVGLTQAEVDAAIDNIYANRASFTDATPELHIGGSNAAPSGTYQYSATPSTGKEKIYALVNEAGINNWAITYTA